MTGGGIVEEELGWQMQEKVTAPPHPCPYLLPLEARPSWKEGGDSECDFDTELDVTEMRLFL